MNQKVNEISKLQIPKSQTPATSREQQSLHQIILNTSQHQQSTQKNQSAQKSIDFEHVNQQIHQKNESLIDNKELKFMETQINYSKIEQIQQQGQKEYLKQNEIQKEESINLKIVESPKQAIQEFEIKQLSYNNISEDYQNAQEKIQNAGKGVNKNQEDSTKNQEQEKNSQGNSKQNKEMLKKVKDQNKKDKEESKRDKDENKKDKEESKKVQITKKELKQYLKIATESQATKKQFDIVKKQKQDIKKLYNNIAKQLILAQEQLGKKTQLVLNYQLQSKCQQQKIQKLENQNSQLSKKLRQQHKKSQKQVGLEETIKQLQKIIDVSTKNQQTYKRESQRSKQFFRIQTENNKNLKIQIQELRHVSSQHFLLKQEVSRLSSELKSLKEAKEQYPKMLQKYQHLHQINQKLKQTIKELEGKLLLGKTITQKLEKKVDKLGEQKKNMDKKLAIILAQKQQRQGEIEAFKMELDDQRTQIQVQRKRYISEIKDLKLALHHEHQKLKLTELQLKQSQKKQKKSVNLQGVKLSSLSKQDLFNIIEQLEMKNGSIKLNLSALIEQILNKDCKIKDLEETLMSLTRQLVKSLPNLEESEGMQYVQKQIIEIGKGNKKDWPQIAQKLIIENLRLKNSVTALGQQYNMMMRVQIEKQQKKGK